MIEARTFAHSLLLSAAVGAGLLAPVVCLAGATAEYIGNTLQITTTAGSAVTVTAVGGFVKVNADDPSTGPLAVTAEINIQVTGDDLGNQINLFAVSPSNGFTNVLSVTIDGGGGNDFIQGSAFADMIYPGPGTDTVDGGAGNDWIIWNKGDGVDTLHGGVGDGDIFEAVGSNLAETFNLTSPGSVFTFTDVGDSVTMTPDGFERANLNMWGGDDQSMVALAAATGITKVTYFGGLGSNTCDASTSEVPMDFSHQFGRGNDTYFGSLSPDDQLGVSSNTNSDPVNFVLTRSGGNNVLQFDNPEARQIVFSGVENLFVSSYIHDDTFVSDEMAGTDLSLISLYGDYGDDRFDIVALPSTSFTIYGAEDYDSLKVHVGSATATRDQYTLNVSGKMPISLNGLEQVSVVGDAPSATSWDVE